MLRDDRLEEQFARAIDPDKPARPGLVDYDRVAREIHHLTVQLVWLHRTMAGRGADIPMPAEPVYPSERYAQKQEAMDDYLLLTELTQSNPTLRGLPKLN